MPEDRKHMTTTQLIAELRKEVERIEREMAQRPKTGSSRQQSLDVADELRLHGLSRREADLEEQRRRELSEEAKRDAFAEAFDAAIGDTTPNPDPSEED